MIARRTLLAAPFLTAPLLAALPARAADPAAAQPIQGLLTAILAAMHAGKSTPFLQRYNILAPAVDRAFDLSAVLSASVGPRLASLPADQQATLADLFRKFTIASYAANFDSFDGERFELAPDQRAVGSDLVVGTRLIPRNGDTVTIDYVMRREAAGWKAVDVLLNGSISQNAVKRSDFRSLVSSSAQPLIDSLRRKVAELSGGTLS